MALKVSAFMKKSGKQPKKEQKGSKSDKLIAWIGDRRAVGKGKKGAVEHDDED